MQITPMFVLAQVLGLVSGLFCMLSGRQKSHKRIMLFQMIDITAVLISNLLLGAVVASIVTVIALIRNIVSYYGKLNKVTLTLIVVSTLGICYGFNGIHTWVDFVIPLNSVIYAFGAYFSEASTTKKFLILNLFVWCAHDIFIKRVSTLIFNLLSITSTTQSLIHDNKLKNKENE